MKYRKALFLLGFGTLKFNLTFKKKAKTIPAGTERIEDNVLEK